MSEDNTVPAAGGANGGSGLRAATLEGVRWITYGRIATELLAITSLAILAHLIRPAAYGHAAIALICQTLAISLTNQGFGSPLVQRRSLGESHFEAAAFMSVGFGLILGAVAFFGAPYVITPIYGRETTYLFQLGSTMFPIYSLWVVPEAILARRLDMRRITMVETAGNLGGTLLAIALAILGFSGAAVVLGTVGGAAVTAVTLLVMVGMPSLRWHRREAGEITRFGVPASLAGVSYLGTQNVDNILVGARLGASPLGLYYRAFALGVANQMKIGAILMRVALPAFSRAGSGEERRRVRHRMARLNSLVIVPLLVLLLVGASRLVPFVLGARWKAAVVPTEILAFAGIATCMTYCAFPFLYAVGRPRAVLMLQVGTVVACATGILIAVPYGLRGVCYAVVATNVLALFAAYVVMDRLGGVSIRHLWLDHAPALVGGAGVAAVTIPLARALLHSHVASVVLLAAIGIAGIAVYLVLLRLVFRRASEDGLLVLRGVLRRPKSSDSRRAESAPSQAPIATQPTPQVVPE